MTCDPKLKALDTRKLPSSTGGCTRKGCWRQCGNASLH